MKYYINQLLNNNPYFRYVLEPKIATTKTTGNKELQVMIYRYKIIKFEK